MQEFLAALPTENDPENKSALYVVATPIGNLKDITLRALEILKEVDFIICEDSRVTAKLLNKYQITDKKFIIYNDHSSNEDRLKILNLVMNGKSMALVSDAGTPLLSDPGHKLIELLKNNNQNIIPIPGVSAVTTLLSVSGIALDNFLFLGFFPNTKNSRVKLLKSISKNYSFIFFESPNRLMESLNDILEVLGDRKVAVGRELTKIYEEVITDKISNVLKYFEEHTYKQKGEIVIAIEKADKDEKELSEEELIAEIKSYLKNKISVKDLSEQISNIYGINKKEIYKKALLIKEV